MVIDLEEQKKKVEEKKKKLQLQEKILKEKEKRRKFKRFSSIVELAFKANLDEIEETTLLGAFSEIAEKMKEEKIVSEWKKIGEKFLHEITEEAKTRMSVSFESDPGKEIKDALKEMKFRWNSFRREYCGLGHEQEIERLLKGTDHKIEVI